ncbi:hypothetical protein ACFQ9X_37475 [Catenulispora yoronensis]
MTVKRVEAIEDLAHHRFIDHQEFMRPIWIGSSSGSSSDFAWSERWA